MSESQLYFAHMAADARRTLLVSSLLDVAHAAQRVATPTRLCYRI